MMSVQPLWLQESESRDWTGKMAVPKVEVPPAYSEFNTQMNKKIAVKRQPLTGTNKI